MTEVVALPPEPSHDCSIEAWDGDSHLVTWHSYDGGFRWMPKGRRHAPLAEDWANIVEAAIRNRWELRIEPPAQLALDDPEERQ